MDGDQELPGVGKLSDGERHVDQHLKDGEGIFSNIIPRRGLSRKEILKEGLSGTILAVGGKDV